MRKRTITAGNRLIKKADVINPRSSLNAHMAGTLVNTPSLNFINVDAPPIETPPIEKTDTDSQPLTHEEIIAVRLRERAKTILKRGVKMDAAEAQRGFRASIEGYRKEYPDRVVDTDLDGIEKDWGKWKALEWVVIQPANYNLIFSEPGPNSAFPHLGWYDPIRQAKYCAGAALELLDEVERLRRDHAKYDRLLLQVSEMVHIAHDEFFSSEHMFERPIIEARARSRNSTKAAEKRHEKNEKMKNRAIELRAARTWPSRYKAAKEIAPAIVLYAKELGTRVSKDRIEQTVRDWFTDHDRKNKPSAS